MKTIRCVAGGAIVLVAGCGALIDILQPNEVMVRLVNNGDLDVTVEMHISDEQDIPEVLLNETNEMVFTLAPGESQTLRRDCDDLQAIIINDADLEVLGAIGPETSTGVLRDGDDFDCGDLITFTFDHSAVLVDFDVDITVEPQQRPFP